MSVNTQRRTPQPNWPQHTDNALHLHLGCGPKQHPAYVNVDILDAPHIHCVQHIDNLSNFETNCADSIYASHCLEHFGHMHTLRVLQEWARVLKPGGIMRISVPDFDKMIAIYHASGELTQGVMQALMGGQDDKYNFHYALFNKRYLSELLMRAGLESINEWKPSDSPLTQVQDWADGHFNVKGKPMPVSLNLCGTKR